jgi:DHA1 family tetracycline resistance protein-like MFS transporter
MGNISDRIGRKPVLLFGYISTAILIIVMSIFTTFSLMASVICVIGFTSGAIWIVGPVISAESVETSKQGAAIGAYRTFFDLGAFLGPIIMTLLWTDYGILPCFYLSAALLFINVPFTLMIKETGKMKGTAISH